MSGDVLLSVGDASGDPYAAQLVRTLRARRPGLRFRGLGGPQMARAGVELIADQRQIAVGGVVEVASRLPRIVSAWRRMAGALRERPDLLVLVDAPDFNLPLARRARARGVRVLYYVLPQAWAWRRGRARKLAARADRLASILPFEAEFYRAAGAQVEFAGHPLVDAIEAFEASGCAADARTSLGVPVGVPAVVLLPGSRDTELAWQLPLQLRVALALHARCPQVHFVLALAPGLSREEARARIARVDPRGALPLTLVHGRTWQAVQACDAALAKPGTVTLECALLGTPMVVTGRGHALSAALLRRLIDVPAWAMPSLVAGERIVPEFLQEQACPVRVAEALQTLLGEPAAARQRAALRAVRARLCGGASERVAGMAEALLGTVGA